MIARLHLRVSRRLRVSFFFFFNDTATTEIYTLSLHDALPIFSRSSRIGSSGAPTGRARAKDMRLNIDQYLTLPLSDPQDRKSTRLNSSHLVISYAVFCLKKKRNITPHGF